IIFVSFFFSSRGRHTMFSCDWSSVVCSSDLVYLCAQKRQHLTRKSRKPIRKDIQEAVWAQPYCGLWLLGIQEAVWATPTTTCIRSEERREGQTTTFQLKQYYTT